jgi:3-(methylthio)propanoyl-CoA dehydrogenase
VHCVSIEHKLGIHGSPTCVMSYGDNGGATGWLVGEENTGLATMFIMMNRARFAVGMEGLGSAEMALQKALGYARTRVQSRDLSGSAGPVPIIQHPDVRRMLMWMKSHTEAMRSLSYTVAWHMDLGERHPDLAARKRHQALADFFVPIVKGWCTEVGIQVASLGIQVHGGMGFIEETGAAQLFRDARIATIYEGTTGIQANDLIGRKLAREGGATMNAWLDDVAGCAEACAGHANADVRALSTGLSAAVSTAREAGAWLVKTFPADIKAAHAGAVPFLELCGITAGAWMLAKSAQIAADQTAAGQGDAFYASKLATAQFFCSHVLPHVAALAHAVRHGSASVNDPSLN